MFCNTLEVKRENPQSIFGGFIIKVYYIIRTRLAKEIFRIATDINAKHKINIIHTKTSSKLKTNETSNQCSGGAS